MATRKPRVVVTLEPHIHATIASLAKLQGCSRGAVISGLLEGAHAALMRTVALLEAAQDAPQQVIDGLRGTLAEMERELVAAGGSGLAGMDWLVEELQSSASADGAPGEGAVPRKAEPARSARNAPDLTANPHVVTRGSGARKAAFHNESHGGRSSYSERWFRVEDLATGEVWMPGLTWTGEAADRSLQQARKSLPGRQWILREVAV